MVHYTVKKLAKMAGVSIRTLHLYDKMGLLKPSIRTEAKYRLYGEKELLRLQQILFYKELEIPLKEIRSILDKPNFDIVEALNSHKMAILAKFDRVVAMIDTIDRTLLTLKEGKMLNHEELYEGLPKEQADVYRNEAIEKWGKEVIEKSETQLRKMTKQELNVLKTFFLEIGSQLRSISDEQPTSYNVQELIRQHYDCICQFWGNNPTAAAYKGLGELYVNDERYVMENGLPNAKYATFMRQAMQFYADKQLS